MEDVDLAVTAARNTSFKTVVATAPTLQLTVMNLAPGKNIGMERHDGHAQLVTVTDGHACCYLNGSRTALGTGSMVLIPPGAMHDITNTDGARPLKLVVTYSPQKFPDSAEYATKEDAERAEQQQQ